jgi:c-di-GMP-binding flagellar brake protein YcgR
MDHNRRAYPRLKTSVPIELCLEDSQSPIRGATADISLTGCYIETIFPMPVGTNLELRLRLDDTLLVLATVVTSDPQVGNGIQFNKMLPEDIAELRAFLEAAEKETTEPRQ